MPGGESNSVGRGPPADPSSALMIRVENLIYSPRELACMRSTLPQSNLPVRSRRRINREPASGMRADAARFRKTERIVIGDEDGFPEHARGNARPFTTARVSCQVPDNSL